MGHDGEPVVLRTRRSRLRQGFGFALIPTGGVAADERFGWSDAAELTIEMATTGWCDAANAHDSFAANALMRTLRL